MDQNKTTIICLSKAWGQHTSKRKWLVHFCATYCLAYIFLLFMTVRNKILCKYVMPWVSYTKSSVWFRLPVFCMKSRTGGGEGSVRDERMQRMLTIRTCAVRHSRRMRRDVSTRLMIKFSELTCPGRSYYQRQSRLHARTYSFNLCRGERYRIPEQKMNFIITTFAR